MGEEPGIEGFRETWPREVGAGHGLNVQAGFLRLQAEAASTSHKDSCGCFPKLLRAAMMVGNTPLPPTITPFDPFPPQSSIPLEPETASGLRCSQMQ